MKKLTKSVLAGPGGEALREMTVGADGLLARARVEAARLVEYVDEITRMNPRLVLTVTSIRCGRRRSSAPPRSVTSTSSPSTR